MSLQVSKILVLENQKSTFAICFIIFIFVLNELLQILNIEFFFYRTVLLYAV